MYLYLYQTFPKSVSVWRKCSFPSDPTQYPPYDAPPRGLFPPCPTDQWTLWYPSPGWRVSWSLHHVTPTCWQQITTFTCNFPWPTHLSTAAPLLSPFADALFGLAPKWTNSLVATQSLFRWSSVRTHVTSLTFPFPCFVSIMLMSGGYILFL